MLSWCAQSKNPRTYIAHPAGENAACPPHGQKNEKTNALHRRGPERELLAKRLTQLTPLAPVGEKKIASCGSRHCGPQFAKHRRKAQHSAALGGAEVALAYNAVRGLALLARQNALL